MVLLAPIDHIRRPTLNPRHRAELHQRLTDLAEVLHRHDRQAVAWAEQRRRIFDEMQRTHDLLWDIDCLNGRQPPRPGEPPLPPTSEDPDPPLRAAAADDVPSDPRAARPPVAARAAHAGAPLRLRRRQQIAGEGTCRCNGVGGARRPSPASRARSLRGHAQVPTATPAAVCAASDAAPGGSVAPVVPGAVVAGGGRRRVGGRRAGLSRTWRLGTRPRGRRGCPRSTPSRRTGGRARA